MTGIVEGRTAIVTGAAVGVGLAIARRFYEAGANVVLADADEDTVQKEAAELDPDKSRALGVRCDPSRRLDLNNLLAASVDAFERVEIVVHTASIVCPGGALDLEEAEFDRSFAVNVKSSFLLSQMAARHMIKRAENEDGRRGHGSIVNVSALSSHSVVPNRFALGVSMAALDQLTRNFAVALAGHGIRVNGIAPGGVAGRFSGFSDPDARKTIVERTPMGRLGEPTEIADAALFLASDQSSFITGQVIVADGGRTIFDMPMPEPEPQ